MTLAKRRHFRFGLILIFFGFGALNFMFGGTFTAFGPQSYVRDTGAPVTVTNTFSVLNPNTQYTLRVDNGGLTDSDTDRVSSTVITVNGVQIVGPNNFNQNVAFVEVAVTLQQANQISVQLRGKPGGTIAVRVFGVDNDPPVINATATPAENVASWNDSNVTVTFTCSDATSGVASCPQPQTITTQGANQVVSGTVVDNAGNTATTSVTLNIDKTAPTIIASQSPPPNAAGWNNTNVTVSFQCSDSLSGVATCPFSQTVSSQGANQTISGTATDVAGNSASATATINLDETPPVISIVSPANNSVSSTSTLLITGTAVDALSGIASTTCNGSAAVFQGSSFTCSINLGPGANTTAIAATDVAGNSSSQSLTVNLGPAITDFNPKSASVGGLIIVSGSGFTTGSGVPQVVLSSQSGGVIPAPVANFTATTLSFVVPDGASSGVLTITVGTQPVTSAATLNIVPSTGFSLTVGPSSANLIQGQTVNLAVTLNSSNGFNQLAALSVNGVPSGVTAQFIPPQITAGQTSLLTLSAPGSQGMGPATLKISASATVNGIALSQSATALLNVQAIATSFMGRAGVDDAMQTPLAGVTVTFLGQDGMGGTTTCSGQTRSDEAGNFVFTNLPDSCIGEQLIRYDGLAATTAKDRNAGTPVKYAGVDLLYNIVTHQVTTPPNVIRLPRIDDKETVLVAQNSSQDQTFAFKTIPNLSVTVYAGTTFTLADGSHPDPFPLIAVDVPVDRLPDEMPNSGNTINAFIVAFQPANAVASQPVAVNFPNTLNTPPSTNMELDTLNPTIGMMVKYGTGTVSNDGTQIVPDFDPAHPNHRFGLVHFDWHGPQAPPPPSVNPGPPNICPPGATCFCPIRKGRHPVDVASGLEVLTGIDIEINSPRGNILIERTYRTLSSNPGPFGIGTNHNYGYLLNIFPFQQGQGLITLVMPDGNQFPFNRQPDGSFVNTTIPTLRGAVMTSSSGSIFNLRWKDGTLYQFQAVARLAVLTAIVDSNGNTISLAQDFSNPGRITQVTDPVGRSLTLSYDSSNRITSVTDPIGRNVQYAYNAQGTLTSVTDPAGGVTSYGYDSQNRLIQITDQRGIAVEEFAYDASGRVTQAIEADGGVFNFSYTRANATVNESMVLSTVVTDPKGNQSTYRFNATGLLTDVMDPSGQIRTLVLDPLTSNQVQAIKGSGSCESCGSASSGDQVFKLDANGNILSQADALGNITSSTYEPNFNKVTSSADALGNETRFTYDAHGSLLTETDANGNVTAFAYNNFGQVTTIIDALGQTTTLTYDTFGNLVSITDPLGNSTTIEYDAISRPIQTIDALGRRSQTVYDPLGRVVKQVNTQGNSTQFAYDLASNLLSITDAKGNPTLFSYDSMNRLATKIDPLGKTDARNYDTNGNLIQFVDRRGQTSTLKYDNLNRLVEADYQDSSVTRSYDALGRPVHVNDSAGGTFDFAFDAAGRLLSSTNQFGTVQYTYDGDNRTVSRRVLGQPALQYAYDAVGNLLSAILPQASASFAYDPLNRLQAINRANNVSSQYKYDAVGRLLSLIHSGPAGVLNAQSYTYDAVGNRTSYATNIGQPLTTPAVSGSSLDADNRLLQNASFSFSYDADGNLTSRTDSIGTTTFKWDARNRLQSVSGPGMQASFQYDFAGNLVLQSVNGNSRTYLLDDLTNIASLNDNGDAQEILSGRSIDEHFAAIHSTGQVEYGLADAVNNTSATVDIAGNQAGVFFYEPSGQTSGTKSAYPFQFTGRIPVATNLYYYRARFYLPDSGRFISEDPIGFAGGDPNLYRYASNNWVRFSDPSGLKIDFSKFKLCVVNCFLQYSVDLLEALSAQNTATPSLSIPPVPFSIPPPSSWGPLWNFVKCLAKCLKDINDNDEPPPCKALVVRPDYPLVPIQRQFPWRPTQGGLPGRP
jgi:RHS repeat-associated protein